MTKVRLTILGFIRKNKFPLILILATLLLFNLFPRDELRSFILLGMLIPIFMLYKFNPTIPILYAVLLLIIAAIFSSKNEQFSSQMAISSFLLLIIGIVCSFSRTQKHRNTLSREDEDIKTSDLGGH